MPGISDLNRCVRDVFDYLYGDAETGALGARLGCATWVCACNDLQDAGPIGISLASSSCSGNTADIAAETSLNAFCAQYTITTLPSRRQLPRLYQILPHRVQVVLLLVMHAVP
jgi:hypothetical protein